jgi:hypothetical protein
VAAVSEAGPISVGDPLVKCRNACVDRTIEIGEANADLTTDRLLKFCNPAVGAIPAHSAHRSKDHGYNCNRPGDVVGRENWKLRWFGVFCKGHDLTS